jgi:hypothetical protein
MRLAGLTLRRTGGLLADRIAPFLVLLALFLGLVPQQTARAAPRLAMGLQDGWAIGDGGDIIFDKQIAQEIRQTGAGWVRIHFRLGPFPNWTDTSKFGYSALDLYDQVVANANEQGLKVLGLVNHESFRQNFEEWTQNNEEAAGGSGDNAYVRDFASEVFAPLVARYAGKVDAWELWNEPNGFAAIHQAEAYDRIPGPAARGISAVLQILTKHGYLIVGNSYIYPSNLAWLVRHSYDAVQKLGLSQPPKILLGGVLGQDIGGESGFNSGADYVHDVYEAGVTLAGWDEDRRLYGSYPLDGVAQHLYIDQGKDVDPAKLRRYLDMVRDAYAGYEGKATEKQTWLTEISWSNDNDTEERQAANLRTAFQVLGDSGYVAAGFWFNLRTIPVANLYRGLLRSDGTPTAAWNAFAELAR